MKLKNGIHVSTDYIFCVNCGEQNYLDDDTCVSCKKMLVTDNDDYCCLCGCQQ